MNKLLEKTEIKLLHGGGGCVYKNRNAIENVSCWSYKKLYNGYINSNTTDSWNKWCQWPKCTDMLNGHREVQIIRYQIFTGSLREVAHWHFQMDVSWFEKKSAVNWYKVISKSNKPGLIFNENKMLIQASKKCTRLSVNEKTAKMIKI